METRLEMLKAIAEKSDKIHDFSYSAILRHLRKHLSDQVPLFLKSFKEAFDTGMEQGIEDIEHVALMEAIQAIGLKV